MHTLTHERIRTLDMLSAKKKRTRYLDHNHATVGSFFKGRSQIRLTTGLRGCVCVDSPGRWIKQTTVLSKCIIVSLLLEHRQASPLTALLSVLRDQIESQWLVTIVHTRVLHPLSHTVLVALWGVVASWVISDYGWHKPISTRRISNGFLFKSLKCLWFAFAVNGAVFMWW